MCNGVELSSGAVRNHDLKIMVKALAIAGYTEDDLKEISEAINKQYEDTSEEITGTVENIEAAEVAEGEE